MLVFYLVFNRWHKPHCDDRFWHCDALLHCEHLCHLKAWPQTSNQHRSSTDPRWWPSLLPLNLSLPQRRNDSRGLVLDEPDRPSTLCNRNSLHSMRFHQDQQQLVPGAPKDNCHDHTEFIKSRGHGAWAGSNPPICRGEYTKVWCGHLPQTVHF